MVIKLSEATIRQWQRGMLMTEVVVAMAILVAVVLPMTAVFNQEWRMCRAHYYEAVAMEIVDGEMEILAAGEWQAVPEGKHVYPVRAQAATNLPPGKFILTRAGQRLQLDWQPDLPGNGRPIQREWRIP